MLCPPMHPTPCREAALDRQERPPQALDTRQRARQVQRVFLHGLRCFGQATVTSIAQSLAYTSHRIRQGVVLRDSSTRP
jgi:hypothetical protein